MDAVVTIRCWGRVRRNTTYCGAAMKYCNVSLPCAARRAYQDGWRDGEDGPLCPKCVKKRGNESADSQS
jgi:hypothetical protein